VNIVALPVSTTEIAERMRLVRNTGREFLTGNSNFITAEEQATWFKDVLHSNHGITAYLFTFNDVDSAYGIVRTHGDKGLLTAVLIPGLRGRGIGRVIFELLIQVAKSNNLTPALDVLKSNTPAVKLYLKMGFRITAESDTTYDMELT